MVLAAGEKPLTSKEVTIGRPQPYDKSNKLQDAVDNETLIIKDPLDPETAQLPILPPIILLDFVNDLDNSSSSGDGEKSKRTIDSNLGYGFAQNDLFNGKYNYYFPSGKSGTTVSIEQSVSPFRPKTIIENVKPITENPGDTNTGYGQNPLQQVQYQPGQQQGNRPAQAANSVFLGGQPVFGQRTKLHKPTELDYTYQSFSTTPKTTVESYTTARPDYRANVFGQNRNVYTTAAPSYQPSYTGSPSGPQETFTTVRPFVRYSTTLSPQYVTSTEPSYQGRYTVTPNSYSTQRPFYDGSSTPRPNLNSQQVYGSSLAQFADLPRYTVENGVRYENKILWKYPDGKVSQTPPSSYINAYNEFLSKQQLGAGSPGLAYQNVASGPRYQQPEVSYQNLNPNVVYQNPNVAYQNLGANQGAYRNQNYQSPIIRYQQNPQESRYQNRPVEGLGNIYSKSPAQFPSDSEPKTPIRPSQFVSSASLAAGNFGIGSRPPGTTQAPLTDHDQFHDFRYQGQYGLKTNLRNPSNADLSSGPTPSYFGLVNPKVESAYEGQRTAPKYAVNSPNPEYTYPSPAGSKLISESRFKTTTPSPELFTPSGSLSPHILSKYSSQAQTYLTKVFGSEPSATTPTSDSEGYSTTSTPYINTNYENLLSYNPSISQYIKDPSSILKAQPTFIQAGGSLIPVIILRVDGAPPIQPTVTPNINLRALLQQYLTQYAGIIGRNSDNGIESDGTYSTASSAASGGSRQRNPLVELTQLAQSLSQYSQNPGLVNSYAQQLDSSLNQNSYDSSFPPRTSYEADKILKSDNSNKYGTRYSKPQKVKSVQIIEDPRFSSYKINS